MPIKVKEGDEIERRMNYIFLQEDLYSALTFSLSIWISHRFLFKQALISNFMTLMHHLFLSVSYSGVWEDHAISRFINKIFLVFILSLIIHSLSFVYINLNLPILSTYSGVLYLFSVSYESFYQFNLWLWAEVRSELDGKAFELFYENVKLFNIFFAFVIRHFILFILCPFLQF